MLCLEKRTERSWDHRIIGTRDFQIIRADKAKEIPIPSPRQQEVDPHVFAEAGDNDKRIDIDNDNDNIYSFLIGGRQINLTT